MATCSVNMLESLAKYLNSELAIGDAFISPHKIFINCITVSGNR